MLKAPGRLKKYIDDSQFKKLTECLKPKAVGYKSKVLGLSEN